MRNLLRFSLVLAAAVLAIGLNWQIASTQSTSKFFNETGHNVEGEILEFFNAKENALFYYGYPITEAIPEDNRNNVYQYFQRVRIDVHTLPDGTKEVKVIQLGGLTIMRDQLVPIEMDTQSSGCRTSEKTGYSICFTFLEFYDKHDGAAVFGEPISNISYENGLVVQYFENARLEWHPDQVDTGQSVQLSHLGRMHFDRTHRDPKLLLPVSKDDIPDLQPISIKLHAFSQKTVVQQGEGQKVALVVVNQNFQGQPGATVMVRILTPNGDLISDLVDSTNKYGFTTWELPKEFSQIYTGTMQLEITAEHGELVQVIRTSFDIAPAP